MSPTMRAALDNLPKAELIDMLERAQGQIAKLKIMNAVLLTNDAAECGALASRLFTPTTTTREGEGSPADSREGA